MPGSTDNLEKTRSWDYALMYILAIIVGGGLGGFAGFRASGRAYMRSHADTIAEANQHASLVFYGCVVLGALAACAVTAMTLARNKAEDQEREASRNTRAAASARQRQDFFDKFGPKE